MTLPVVHTVAACRAWLAPRRAAHDAIGLVPTMGALHEGHAALIRAARIECAAVVVWVFVNPTQFGPAEDFGRYPRTLDADVRLAAAAGADLVFAPAVEEVYPPGHSTFVDVEGVSDRLCGASRPGHFRGVATVVLKMLNMVQPDRAYFGQKDAQQVRVVERMVADLNVPTTVRVVPTVREADGLALSSRNRYLSATDRAAAAGISHALHAAALRVAGGDADASAVVNELRAALAAIPGATVDYAEAADADTLRPLDRLAGRVLLAVAVKLGATRLIDNMTVDAPGRAGSR